MKFVYFLTLLLHLGFAAVLLGGSSLAVIFDLCAGREQDNPCRRLSGDLLARVTLTPGSAVMLVFTLAIAFLSLSRSYAPVHLPGVLWGGVLLLLAAGLALLHLYRALRGKAGGRSAAPLVGLAGLTLLGSVYAILGCAAAFLLMPERWPVLAATPTLVLSWSGTARFLEFFTLSLILAGAGMVLFTGRTGNESYDRLLARTGARVAFVSLLVWPLWLLLDLVNLPFLAPSALLFLAAAGAVVAAAAASLLLLPYLAEPPRGGGSAPFLLALCLLFLFVLGDHLGRESALNRYLVPLAAAEETATAADEKPFPGAVQVPTKTPAGADGGEVFSRFCSGCHAFDRGVVGPPLNTVVPGYRGRREALEDFIRNPVKKNPDYPAMPALGLSEAELAAVAGYLLEKTAP